MTVKTSLASLFELHLHQLMNKENKAEQMLMELKPSKVSTFVEKCLWLWALTEQIGRFKNYRLIKDYQSTIETGISDIQRGWQSPHDSLWNRNQQEIHTSVISMAYAALLGLKNQADKKELQPTITAIRDSIFNGHLTGGMLTCARGVNEITIEQLFAVMPFGLFSPEDLVMVEAVKEMEDRLVTKEGVFPYRGASHPSPSSAVMLSWYFYEKGVHQKARYYLEIAKKTEASNDSFYEVLHEILLQYMNEQLEEEEAKILHKPYGHDNPYRCLAVERSPRDPEIGQTVYVFTQLLGISHDEVVEVRLYVKEGEQTEWFPCMWTKRENDIVWQGQIKSNQPSVTYWFEAITARESILSQRYSLSYYQRMAIRMFNKVGEDSDNLWVSGDADCRTAYVFFNKKQETFGVTLDRPEIDFRLVKGVSTFEVGGKQVYISERSFSIENNGCVLLTNYPDSTFPILGWLENEDGNILQTEWNFHSPLKERFFGLGERYHKLEYRGEEMDCHVYNQYRDQGNRTYMPVPFFVSSLGYGLHLNTDHYSVFDFAHRYSDRLQIRCHIHSSKLRQLFQLYTGSPKEIVSQFTVRTGKAALPPVWAFGPWMSSNNWDRDSVVREQVEKTNEHRIPSTVIVLEQWSDEATYYIFNDAEYEVKPGKEAHRYDDYHFPASGRWPNPKLLIDHLHQHGLKVILWQIPIQKYLNRQHHPQKDQDEKYMIERGYCVKDENGKPYRIREDWFKESLLMDFSHPEGTAWWFQKRQYLLDIGVDGFKTDGGEFVFGRNLQFYDGSTGSDMRNRYPNEYIKAYYQFATSHNKKEALTFSRAGYTGAQQFPAHWAGDERSTFAAFRHSLIAGLSTGMSGIPMWGWDLAGFNGDIPSAELFIRSAQMAAFCPIMQYHAESKAEFNQDRTPWNIADRTKDQRAIAGYREFANIRMNLLPYIYEQAIWAAEQGNPMMRSMFMEYPTDEKVFDMYDQYFFGEKLMVAPIIKEGAVERTVYFPEGTWINLFNHDVVAGPAIKQVHAPLMDIPVYVKAGSAIMTNCGNDFSLGSWVGNDINSYKNSVLRLYPVPDMQESIRDHLGNEWTVEVKTSIQEEIEVSVKGDLSTIILIPQKLIKKNLVKVNGKKAHSIKNGSLIFQT